MTTLKPRPPYSQDELDRLYPKSLQLEQVQIVSEKNTLRRGEMNDAFAHFDSEKILFG